MNNLNCINNGNKKSQKSGRNHNITGDNKSCYNSIIDNYFLIAGFLR